MQITRILLKIQDLITQITSKAPQGFVCGIFEKICVIAQACEEKSVQSEQSVV